MTPENENEAIKLLKVLANYTENRLHHPECAFCGSDMQDGLIVRQLTSEHIGVPV